MPFLGVSNCMVDLVATGSTLCINYLVEVETIMGSQASVFTLKVAMKDASKKKKILKIVDAVRSVFDAEGKKYLMANVPGRKLKDVETGIGGPTVMDLAGNADYAAVQAIILADDSYHIVIEMKKIGAKGFFTVPLERLVE